MPSLPDQRTHERECWKQHRLGTERGCGRVRDAACLLRISQVREVGLGKPEKHEGLERLSNSPLALKSLVRLREHGFRFRGAPAAQQ